MSDTDVHAVEMKREGERASLVRDSVRTSDRDKCWWFSRPFSVQNEADEEGYSFRRFIGARSFRLGLLISIVIFLITVALAVTILALLRE